MITVGSLFSGIGGIDLGLERAGMRVIWQSEIDPYACRVLAKHWPGVPNLGDITKIEWSHVQRPELICGGYPCQPFSAAGKRTGEHDARHLWPHMGHAVRVLRPDWVLLENVPGHLSLGFGRVLAELAACRYDTQWDCIPAAAVGAPHLRDRLFVVAGLDQPPSTVPDAERNHLRVERQRQGQQHREQRQALARGDGAPRPLADADGTTRRQTWDAIAAVGHRTQLDAPPEPGRRGDGEHVADGEGEGQLDGTVDASVACLCGDPGSRGHWAAEPDVGRVAHGVPHRMDRLRVLGNAVVPQVAEWIGRQIVGDRELAS